MWSNYKLLLIVNQEKKTKCFAGDSLKVCVQIPYLLKNLWENVFFVF